MSARAAFDAHAADYAQTWGRDPIARLQRRRVHETLGALLDPDSHVLDLGCGVGTDAAHLVGQGHRITAADISPAMLQATLRACEPMPIDAVTIDLTRPSTLPDGPFDAVLSNFGALNCSPLRPVASALAERVRTGGCAVVVVMARHCPVESTLLALRGHPREALRRRRRRSVAVHGHAVDVRYLRVRDVLHAFRPWFHPVSVEGLGVVLPPTGDLGRPLHGLGPTLDRVDRRLGRLPILRGLGDHTLVALRRA